MELDELAAQIKDRDDLVDFIHALRLDLQQNEGRWENATLETFLEAMAAVVQDLDGRYRNRNEPMPEKLSWRDFAALLLASRIYE